MFFLLLYSIIESLFNANINIIILIWHIHIGLEIVDVGNLRETFFLNQLSVNNNVAYPKTGFFLADDKYLFEVEGKSKTQKQIVGIENAFIAADLFSSCKIKFLYHQRLQLQLKGVVTKAA